MKKRIFSITLALTMLLALGVQTLAEEGPNSASEPGPEYRLVSVVEVSGGYPMTYSFTYGQGGHLPTEVTCPDDMNCPITAAYDEAGRLTALQDSYRTISNVYDEAGNRVRTEKATDYGDGPTTVVTEYTYDEAGNRIRTEQTTDSGDSSTAVVTEYTYDEAGNCVREERITDYGDSSTTVVAEYAYDEAGNRIRTEVTTDSGDSSTTVVSEYSYDEAGNCVWEEHTHNYGSDNAYSNTIEYTYDSEGRKLSAVTTDTSEGSTTTYTYTYSEDGRSATQTCDDGSVIVEYETPPLDTSWEDTSIETVDGTLYSFKRFTLYLKALKADEDQEIRWTPLESTEDQDVFSTAFFFDSEPTLTYDGNGCLVKVEGADGEYVELTWEPVA